MYTFASGAGPKQFHLSAVWFDEDRGILVSSGGSGDLRTYWSTTASGTVYDPARKQATDNLSAFGCALERTVTSVVGTTTTGRSVETEVIDGFWVICIAPRERRENWVSLTATRADGSVAHRYRVP